MKLTNFRIFNYMSANDIGEIIIGKIASLVGRDEGGKSNIILALHSLNPSGGPQDLSIIKDFPRHRRLPECAKDTSVVEIAWVLGASELAEPFAIFTCAKSVMLCCQ